jgi:hypothetical protein
MDPGHPRKEKVDCSSDPGDPRAGDWMSLFCDIVAIWGMLWRSRGSPEDGSVAWFDPRVAIDRKARRRERPGTKPGTKVHCTQM